MKIPPSILKFPNRLEKSKPVLRKGFASVVFDHTPGQDVLKEYCFPRPDSMSESDDWTVKKRGRRRQAKSKGKEDMKRSRSKSSDAMSKNKDAPSKRSRPAERGIRANDPVVNISAMGHKKTKTRARIMVCAMLGHTSEYHELRELAVMMVDNVDEAGLKLFALPTITGFRGKISGIIRGAMDKYHLKFKEGIRMEDLVLHMRITSLTQRYERLSKRLGDVGVSVRTLLLDDRDKIIQPKVLDGYQTYHVRLIAFYGGLADSTKEGNHGQLRIIPDPLQTVSHSRLMKQSDGKRGMHCVITPEPLPLNYVDLIYPWWRMRSVKMNIGHISPFIRDHRGTLPKFEALKLQDYDFYPTPFDALSISVPVYAQVDPLTDGYPTVSPREYLTTFNDKSPKDERIMKSIIRSAFPDFALDYSAVTSGKRQPFDSVASLGKVKLCTADNDPTLHGKRAVEHQSREERTPPKTQKPPAQAEKKTTTSKKKLVDLAPYDDMVMEIDDDEAAALNRSADTTRSTGSGKEEDSDDSSSSESSDSESEDEEEERPTTTQQEFKEVSKNIKNISDDFQAITQMSKHVLATRETNKQAQNLVYQALNKLIAEMDQMKKDLDAINAALKILPKVKTLVDDLKETVSFHTVPTVGSNVEIKNSDPSVSNNCDHMVPTEDTEDSTMISKEEEEKLLSEENNK